MAAILVSFISIIHAYNLLSTRRLPQFDKQEVMTVRKIKHILTAFVFCLILSASTIPVCASAVSASNEETGYVYVLDDSADFLTDSQENSLQKQLYDLTAYCNVAFVTTTGHSKSSTEDFAADYFDDVFGAHANGTIFVIDRCLNEIYLYSDGQAHKIITNSAHVQLPITLIPTRAIRIIIPVHTRSLPRSKR